jgi:hypothetical protein
VDNPYHVHHVQTHVENILIYDSDEQEIPTLSKSISYLMDLTNAVGDFPCHITIYPRLPAVDERLSDDTDRLAFISQFCALLSCEALAESGDSPDLEQGWVILNGNGIRHEVILYGDAIVNDGSFIILSTNGEAS